MLKFKITIPLEVMRDGGSPLDWLYDKIIEQNNIDTDFYLVRIDSIKTTESAESCGKHVYAKYYLIRRKIWEDLEESIERLKIGL